MDGTAIVAPDGAINRWSNRTHFLDYLYRLDGRDDPEHPRHAVYTGLMTEYRYRIGQQVIDELVTRWQELGPELNAHLDAMRLSMQPVCSPTT